LSKGVWLDASSAKAATKKEEEEEAVEPAQ